MAYESRFYVVDKSDLKIEARAWGEKIAMFDLCCVPEISGIIRKKYQPTDCYIYEGNEQLLEDLYGDPLLEIPVNDMIEMLEDAMHNKFYRRYQPFLQMLKGFNLKDWNNLVVLHFGH